MLHVHDLVLKRDSFGFLILARHDLRSKTRKREAFVLEDSYLGAFVFTIILPMLSPRKRPHGPWRVPPKGPTVLSGATSSPLAILVASPHSCCDSALDAIEVARDEAVHPQPIHGDVEPVVQAACLLSHTRD